ncbi:G-protein coupled receptor GRL101-like [Palaemon carinicauda]|uniref:G-protein coupled receptor GRL101-like n=1 Tax=Palaemon carinicauda TaxID=392227 RepID=UPI0035B6788D
MVMVLERNCRGNARKCNAPLPNHVVGLIVVEISVSKYSIDLSSQQLQEIAPRAFVGLRNLTTLYLSDNYLVSLDEAVFTGLRNLHKLDLTNNELAILSGRIFQGLPRLAYLATDEWRWCCLVKHVETCLPEADQFSSCEDLMSNIVLRVCIWILGLIALFGNSFVIFWRSIYSSGNKPSG